MSAFPEAWNQPPESLRAVRKGDAWVFRVDWEPPALVTSAVLIGLMVPICGGSFAWLDQAGLGGAAETAVLAGVFAVYAVLAGAVLFGIGRLGGETFEIGPAGLRMGRTHIPRQELAQATATHVIDETRDSKGRVHRDRVEVLRIGSRDRRVALPQEAVIWIAGAINYLRVPTTAEDREAKAALQKGLSALVDRATETER